MSSTDHHDRLTGLTIRKGEWGKALILIALYALLYVGGGWLAMKFLVGMIMTPAP